MQLNLIEKAFILEAIFFLTLAKISILLIPFKFLSNFLGEENGDPKTFLSLREQDAVSLIGLSINYAANNLPWKSVCLPRAMAAKVMLRRRRIESTLFLGLSKNKESKILSAHAWIKAGDQIVTGKNGIQDKTIITSFV